MSPLLSSAAAAASQAITEGTASRSRPEGARKGWGKEKEEQKAVPMEMGMNHHQSWLGNFRPADTDVDALSFGAYSMMMIGTSKTTTTFMLLLLFCDSACAGDSPFSFIHTNITTTITITSIIIITTITLLLNRTKCITLSRRMVFNIIARRIR